MKVLIIGLGSIAKKHISALQSLVPENELEIYALRSSKASQSYQNIINVYTLEEIPGIQFIDFCIISSPTSKHEEHITACLKYDFPLFIEKPLSHYQGISKIADQLKDRKTYIACNLRFLECINFVKQAYLSDPKNRVNEVNVYCGSHLPDWRPGQDYKKNYSSIPELGGGVHLDLIHELDYVYWLFGEPKKTMNFHSKKSSLGIEAVDAAYYFWEYTEFNTQISLNYFRKDPKRTLEIVFADKTLLVDLLKNTVYQDGNKVYESKNTILDTYTTQLKYFLENQKPFNDFQEALKVLTLCLK
ncbi:MAG: Gfo/Idh/MocA family oxidoreductase [Flavobacteriales bacterium]|jgi:predicted dehydrogenase|nr:Gfo/Idh/MocA family oxidoreductase [Flavobacteriales bacterium]